MLEARGGLHEIQFVDQGIGGLADQLFFGQHGSGRYDSSHITNAVTKEPHQSRTMWFVPRSILRHFQAQALREVSCKASARLGFLRLW